MLPILLTLKTYPNLKFRSCIHDLQTFGLLNGMVFYRFMHVSHLFVANKVHGLLLVVSITGGFCGHSYSINFLFYL